MAIFAEVSDKLGPIKPETLAIAREVFDFAVTNGHTVRYLWGYDGDVNNTEHHAGLAVDFMINNHADGQAIRDYIWANRDRLRLHHVIWEQHITSTVVSPGETRLMADRGDTTANHMDHVHAFFNAGAYQAPGATSEPKPTPAPRPVPEGLIVDGDLGPKTISRWQQVMGTYQDGIISTPSQLVSAVQRYLNTKIGAGLTVDGRGIAQDGRHYNTVAALQRYLGTYEDGVMSTPFSSVVRALQVRLNKGYF